MQYGRIVKGIFMERMNRFVARVQVNETCYEVHVKNTGRCKELLIPGVHVVLEAAVPGSTRKTDFSLIAVMKGQQWVNIDSIAPNHVVSEALKIGAIRELPLPLLVKREVFYGASRFDLYYEATNHKGFVEVKGVTLEQDGVAMFPDAPTERGTKHIYELIDAVEHGFHGTLFFLIQMRGPCTFTPNRTMDPRFSDALTRAIEAGVQVLAYDANVGMDRITLGGPVQVQIN